MTLSAIFSIWDWSKFRPERQGGGELVGLNMGAEPKFRLQAGALREMLKAPSAAERRAARTRHTMTTKRATGDSRLNMDGTRGNAGFLTGGGQTRGAAHLSRKTQRSATRIGPSANALARFANMRLIRVCA